jgi:small subunit ribosomal protein S8
MITNNSLRDALVRIKNGYLNRKKEIVIIKTKLCLEILKILREEGYVQNFRVEERNIVVTLKYFRNKPVLRDITFHSPLHTNTTISYKQLKKHYGFKERKLNGLGLTVLSTSRGLLSDYECISQKSGGNLLLTIL